MKKVLKNVAVVLFVLLASLAFMGCGQQQEVCESCNGTGVLEAGTQFEKPCYNCNGTGINYY